MSRIEELLAKAKAQLGEQEVPAPPKPPERKELEKKPTEKKPEDGEDEIDEILGISKRKLEAAKAEYESYERFLDLYADGDDKAFENPIIEGDDPLIARVTERPPKTWFEKAVKAFEESDDPAAVAAWVWHNWVSPRERERIRERYGRK
jgi:hypothetical protein